MTSHEEELTRLLNDGGHRINFCPVDCDLWVDQFWCDICGVVFWVTTTGRTCYDTSRYRSIGEVLGALSNGSNNEQCKVPPNCIDMIVQEIIL